MWTLIIILSGTFGATSMAIDHVDGFPTAKSCNQAVAAVNGMLLPSTPNPFTIKTTCLYKPLTAAATGK